jgi:hypothetical protein
VVCQCKKYSRPVGNKAVQETFAAMKFYGAQAGAVITNAAFTRSAMELADATNVRLMHFSDLLRFNSTMIPGAADIDPADLAPSEIEPEGAFRRRQTALWVLVCLCGLAGAGFIIAVVASLPTGQ